MAVTKLSLLCLVGELADFDKTLLLCINDETFHIEEATGVVDDIDGVSQFNDSGAFAQSLMQSKSISDIMTKLKNISDLSGINIEKDLKNLKAHTTPEYISFNNKLGAVEEILDRHHKAYMSMIERRDRCRSTISDDEKVVEQLKNIMSLDTKLSALFSFEFMKIRFGQMPRESYDSLSYYTADVDDYFFIPSNVYKKTVWGMYITPRSKSKRVDALFNSLKFERTRISDRATGTPLEAINELQAEIASNQKTLAQINREIEEYTKSCRADLLEYYEQLSKLQLMVDMHKKAVRTKSSFCILGWIPKACIDGFLKKLEEFPNVVCTNAGKQYRDKLKPPTLLKNPGIFKPFEEFVEMYGLPAHNEIDPTPFLAITYFIFFGMMFGDLGQGALMVIAGLVIWFWKRVNLGRIISIIGVSSMAFGLVYGSVFGKEDIIPGIFKPMHNMNGILIGAVVVGASMISIAMVINIINGVKQKNVLKAVFSHNGIAGLMFYWAVLCAALMMFNLAPLRVSITVFVSVAVFMMLLIFLREPLAGLVSRKNSHPVTNKVEFVIENFFECFEIVLSFVTNTISFIRIGAFALSHVGMMEVVFALARTAEGTNNPVILVVGNLVVICLEGMVVGIQGLRLEYYELLGRFFEGDGRSFEITSGKK